MFDIAAQQVWLAPGATDMRKSIDGLSALAQYALGKNPLESHLFAFCSRDQSKIKLLYWDRNGFWLFYRRLEKGVFRWPAHGQAPLCISRPAVVVVAGRPRHRTGRRASPAPRNPGAITRAHRIGEAHRSLHGQIAHTTLHACQ